MMESILEYDLEHRNIKIIEYDDDGGDGDGWSCMPMIFLLPNDHDQ